VSVALRLNLPQEAALMGGRWPWKGVTKIGAFTTKRHTNLQFEYVKDVCASVAWVLRCAFAYRRRQHC